MTGVCFICEIKFNARCTQVYSSITPFSNITYPEKIAEIIGDEFVVIVNPADYICFKCNKLLINYDKVDNDLKLVKNEIITYIKTKYGILPPDQVVKGVEIVSGHLKPEKQLEGQHKVPSVVRVGVSPTVTTDATLVKTPLKLLETQQQQRRPQHLEQSPTPQDKSNKIYKCSHCEFDSKKLGDFEFHKHIMNHVKKEETEEPILNQDMANAILAVPQPKVQLYRCLVCDKSFYYRIKLREHIHKEHNPSTLN